MQDRPMPRAIRARARRVPGSASRGRSGPRIHRRCGRARSSNSRDEGANSVVILDPGLPLEARAGVHRPRLHRLDRLADVFRREPSGEHDPAYGGAGALEVLRVFLLPCAVDDPRNLLVAAQQDAVTGTMAILARAELGETAGCIAAPADVDR